jgi:hypothetical protein
MRTTFAAVGIAMALSSIAAAQSSNSLPDTPANHWMYQAKADLKSIGLLVGYPDGLGYSGVRPMNRYEMAVATHASMSNLHQVVLDLESSNEKIARFAGRPEDEPKDLSDLEKGIPDDVKSLRRILPTIKKDLDDLTKAFSPQLRTLGVDPDDMLIEVRTDCQMIASFHFSKLGEATKPFADVPQSHWAARAVQELKAAGILHGYTADRFGG